MNPRVLTEMEHGVATVRLDAPPLNAFDSTMRKELTDAAAALEVEDSLRVVVRWGGPSCFAAGAALQYARRPAAGPRFALSAIKEAAAHAGGPAGLALERALIAGLSATEDRARGMRSFIEHGPGRAEFG